MQVAIVIVHYQNLEDTLRCVGSLKQLDYKDNFVVIVDSCSPNKSGQKLKELLPELTVILNPVNKGFAVSCNLGIKHARNMGASYIWLLNPDTTAASEALSKLLEAAKSNAGYAAFGSKIFYGDKENIIWSAGAKIDFEKRTLRMLGNGEQDGSQFQQSLECDYLPGCSLFASTETFNTPLPEEYFMYFEETDWCQKIRRSGRKLMLVPESKVYHFTSDDKMQAPANIYYYNRNELLFWYKFTSPAGRITLLADTLFRKLPRNVRAYIKAPSEQLKVVFKAHVLSVVDFILGRFGKRY